MVGVDVGALDGNERLDVLRGGAGKPLARAAGRDDLDQFALEAREAQSSVEAARVADLDELLVHELDAPLARDLEHLDLRLDEEVEGHLGHEGAGRGPVEFRIAVRMSRAERLDVGSMDSRALPRQS